MLLACGKQRTHRWQAAGRRLAGAHTAGDHLTSGAKGAHCRERRASGASDRKERRGEVESTIRDNEGIRSRKVLLTIVSLASRSGIVAKAEIFHRLSFGIVGDCVGPSGCYCWTAAGLSVLCLSESTTSAP